MAFSKKQYDYYDWSDMEDLFSQLNKQQERFKQAKTTYTSKKHQVVTPDDLNLIRGAIKTLSEDRLISATKTVNYKNIEEVSQYSYLQPKYFTQIENELQAISKIANNFSHYASNCSEGGDGGGGGGSAGNKGFGFYAFGSNNGFAFFGCNYSGYGMKNWGQKVG